ncbi:N-6 DNA methylase [Gardnerella sp. DNF00186]|jgi:type II restriction-modification system methylation subunit|nr:restriction endonuclease subunit M [Bifidobacteriaceae bacterium NR020]
MASAEEKVEEFYKAQLDELNIRHYGKTEEINSSITKALKEADSKSGGSGNNYPDIQLLLQNSTRRDIPVMIEAKGTKNKLEKLSKDGDIELISKGKNPHSVVQQYAVNGALHYGLAILDEGTYSEVIVIGINGWELKDGWVSNPELKAYYISKKNGKVPKEIPDFDFSQMKSENIDSLYNMIDRLLLTDKELESLKRDKEELLEQSIKSIHQRIYDDSAIKNLLSTNDKLYFFCGLIMAGLTTEGVKPLEVTDFYSNDDEIDNDGKKILNRTNSFLQKKKCPSDKIEMVNNYLKPVFEKRDLWKPVNGESVIKAVYKQVKEEILPLLESNIHLDFTGKILNSLNDWVLIDNDKKNDVVLTPRFVTNLMARIARTNKDSFVWDTCMGSSGFLVSAMELMIDDAKSTIKDNTVLDNKIKNIKQNQLLGIEILGNIYILAVLNMILMGDGSSQIICGDSHKEAPDFMKSHNFPANVFLLNPPYSAPGKGLNFVDEALSKMETGYGAVLIQENAGSGQGEAYAQHILKENTLLASIHMPADLFNGKSSVQTAIYLFKVNRAHEVDDMVTFIDFSNDGYARQNRKKSTQKVNLRNVDHALERYDEIVAICLGKKPKTDYYTEVNGLVIKDTITINGDDWTYNQHKKIDTTPTEEDFKKTVADYLAWKVSAILKGEVQWDE